MATDNKIPELVGVSDKQKMMQLLKEAGFDAEMDAGGVPTAVGRSISEMDTMIPAVRKIAKNNRYEGSFGIRGPRKTDIGKLPEEQAGEQAAG